MFDPPLIQTFDIVIYFMSNNTNTPTKDVCAYYKDVYGPQSRALVASSFGDVTKAGSFIFSPFTNANPMEGTLISEKIQTRLNDELEVLRKK